VVPISRCVGRCRDGRDVRHRGGRCRHYQARHRARVVDTEPGDVTSRTGPLHTVGRAACDLSAPAWPDL
jgi:hypothetical protein